MQYHEVGNKNSYVDTEAMLRIYPKSGRSF
jgi:hypothetical protein